MSAVVHLGDCLEVMRGMEANSVDLICTDPPYFKVKMDEAWDRQWQNPAAFLAWLDTVFAEFQRILKPNGSLYVFASPQMAARVEVQVSERFNVLNHIVWRKEAGRHMGSEKEALRGFFPQTERVIFAEHFGAADISPIGSAICQARQQTGLKATDIDVALGYVRTKDPTRGTELCRRWEEGSSIPSEADFSRAFAAMSQPAPQYEDLRQQYEDLRRPFAVTPHVPHTDVWDFPTVGAYDGKHPCEKPLSLLEHIITASSRPGAVVFDAFTGSGASGQAAVKLGREFIGAEIDPHWQRRATRRIANAQPALLSIN